MSNSVENTEVQNKNLSPELRNLIDEANIHAKSAEDKILEAYDYAVNTDKLEPKLAAKVLYDNLNYSPRWIRNFLPEEAKHLEKKRLPNKSAEAVPQIIEEIEPKVVNITTQTEIKEAELIEEKPSLGYMMAKQITEAPEEYRKITESIQKENEEFKQFREEKAINEDLFIPPNRFRKFFLDLMKVRTAAIATGVYITKDLEVKV